MRPKPRYSSTAVRYTPPARIVHRSNLSPPPAEFDAGSTYPRRVLPDDVQSRCWCDRSFVWVTLDEVNAYRTITCGRPDCQPPQQENP